MYQKVIRDPTGQGLIRIVPDVCGDRNAVVNGSILLVPAGTVAFVSVNGILSTPYMPGRHTLFTGVDPFFVRLRNIMTHGDAGISVSVFYISTDKTKFMQLGTGEIPFLEHRFRLTMKALASCSLTYYVKAPEKVLKKLVGAYSSDFCEDDIEPCLTQLILSPIKETLSKELAKCEVHGFNSNLTSISRSVSDKVTAVFESFGLGTSDFNVTGINVPENEMQRLSTLEADHASGVNRTDLEKYNLDRIWNGDVDKRTISEAVTGFSSRGAQVSSSGEAQNVSGTDNAIKLLLLSQLFPSLANSFGAISGQNTRAADRAVTNTPCAPPPVPKRLVKCHSCKRCVSRKDGKCPVCGAEL